MAVKFSIIRWSLYENRCVKWSQNDPIEFQMTQYSLYHFYKKIPYINLIIILLFDFYTNMT